MYSTLVVSHSLYEDYKEKLVIKINKIKKFNFFFIIRMLTVNTLLQYCYVVSKEVPDSSL